MEEVINGMSGSPPEDQQIYTKDETVQYKPVSADNPLALYQVNCGGDASSEPISILGAGTVAGSTFYPNDGVTIRDTDIVVYYGSSTAATTATFDTFLIDINNRKSVLPGIRQNQRFAQVTSANVGDVVLYTVPAGCIFKVEYTAPTGGGTINIKGVVKLMADKGYQLAGALLDRVQTESIRDGYLYNGLRGLLRWRAALAKALNGDVLSTICVYGSSSVVGQGAGGGGVAGLLTYGKNKLEKGFVGRLRSALAKQAGDVGSGIIPHWWTWWYTFAGTWADSSVGGMLNIHSKRGETVGSSVTVTFTGTSFSVVGIESAEGGKFTITMDGGTPQEFNSNGSSEAAKEYKYNGTLTNSSHTAVITVTELVAGKARSGFALIGVMYGSTSQTGVKVHQIGYAGGKTDQIATNRTNYKPTTVDFWKPDLSIICFSSNDYSGQTDLATFRTQTQTAITQCKRFGDVLLVPVGITPADKSIPITEYSKIYRELALLNDCAFYDTYARYDNSFTFAKETLQYVSSDNTHMNDYGHQDISSSLYKVLTNV